MDDLIDPVLVVAAVELHVLLQIKDAHDSKACVLA